MFLITSNAGSLQRRSPVYVDIQKGSPNYTITRWAPASSQGQFQSGDCSAAEFLASLRRRRTVRQVSPRPVPREIIEDAIRTAGSAPSGANLQPWHFVVIGDPAVKTKIRLAAEAVPRCLQGSL